MLEAHSLIIVESCLGILSGKIKESVIENKRRAGVAAGKRWVAHTSLFPFVQILLNYLREFNSKSP